MHEDPKESSNYGSVSADLACQSADADRSSCSESDLEKRRAYNRDRSRRLRLDPAYREKEHWSFIKRAYNLTKDQWIALFEKQGKVCACCGTSDPGSKLGWHTDHDHDTNTVRGILCHHCNIILGCIRDSAERAEILGHKLTTYLGLHG